MNRVFLMGNLTRDVEIRHLANNTAVGSFGLAVTRRYMSNGEKKEETAFVDCTAWGKTAEIAGQYLRKGSKVAVEGRLKLDQWEDKQTKQNRSKLHVVVENLEFVGSKGDGEQRQSAPAARPSRASAPPPSPLEDIDIPFE